MQTSRCICDRILWDARLNAEAFTVGYAVRQRHPENQQSNEIREKPFLQWVSQTDIPWHRIRYIRCADILVWERDRHIDLFSTNQLPSAAFVSETVSETPLPPPPTFNQATVYQNISQSWQPQHQVESVSLSQLTVVTYNVLCDTHESERIQTAKRIPAIISQIKNCNADIIALQEATPALLQALLSETWLRDYFISEPANTSQLTPYGLLLISRLPFTLKDYRFSSHKRVLVASFSINNQPLQVAVVHLTSNRAYNAAELQTEQLKIILSYLNSLPGDCLIVGDFNNAGVREATLRENHFFDVWQGLRPNETGYTFDPQTNALAAVNSQTGTPSRLDKIWLRSHQKNWQPQNIELFATTAIPETQNTLYPSDHFGLKAILEYVEKPLLAVQTVKPVYQSAIVLIPPMEIWPVIQKIRQKYDSKVGRWMPHITLIYGFVPEKFFAEAVQLIQPHLESLQPFEITLSEFDTFQHRQNCTAWLRPAPNPPQALHQLQATLQQLFPQCNEQSNKSRAGFTPHLSVGQFKNPAEAQALLPVWHPLTFRVESVALISRRGDEPFQVQQIVKLGSQPASQLLQIIRKIEPELTHQQRENRSLILAIIQQACQECLSGAKLELFGSARLGVETPESDIDAVCVIPAKISETSFLRQVAEKLQGLSQECRLVEGTLPTLRLQLEGLDVDLLCACTNSNPREKHQPLSLKGCWEADELLSQVEKRVPVFQFREFLRIVRAWAKVRCIHGNAWGFLGNFSWALLAAICCRDFPKHQEITLENLLSHFFTTLSAHDWKNPLSLSEAGRCYQVKVPPDWLPIISTLEPCQNTARNVTRSTAEIIRREFARGKAILAEDKSGETLFKPASLITQSQQFIILTVTPTNSQDLKIYAGWIEGQIIGLVIDLEKQLKAFVRPWPAITNNAGKIEIILGWDIPVSFNYQALESIINNFISRFQESKEQSQECRWKFQLKNPDQM
ncbi:RNA repair domain-containing protein [Ancylothrix sp. C2]|uniref:poly(A) polymerase n=1 Tax=Ancylothrix sp. D3o TaxID=2953691 RepID=UPI0021BA699D|nr:poly(A) polymerase [Ancylothrix sp. D3o]MCT7951301.1 RNA repair domain-containing protein [Ancylothrix sp. D3o]